MALTDLYVQDKESGKIHRIGDDPHDSIWVGKDGVVHYHNLQNGDGANGNGDCECGYRFVPSDCGELRVR